MYSNHISLRVKMVDILGIIDTEGNQSNRTQKSSEGTKNKEYSTTNQPCHETRAVVESCLNLTAIRECNHNRVSSKVNWCHDLRLSGHYSSLHCR